MKKITYFKVTFTLESSLSIGSGIGEYTDKDIAVDRNGKPYIPATSIAGVMRSSFSDALKKYIFGSIENGADEGCVRFYDAVLCNGSDYYISTRDCVELSEKVAVDGAKFDFQTIEPGTSFVSFIEVHSVPESKSENSAKSSINAAGEIQTALNKFNTGELRLGSKTTRGYGRVSVSVGERVFEIPNDLSDWLSFDQYTYANWTTVDFGKYSSDIQYITLDLKNTAGITIREYTTDYAKNATLPDYRQLSLHDNSGKAVIPGTSWAGAFRQRFAEFAKSSSDVDELFGYVKKGQTSEDDSVKKSAIVFSESILEGGTRKQLTRNSIDRFSAATKAGALYTEETYYGGTTALTISFPKGVPDDKLKILANVILDLHFGYLAIGGLTSVGRGVFEIERFRTNMEVLATALNAHGIKREVQ